MANSEKIVGSTEAWEHGDLGQSEEHAVRVDSAKEREIDAAMGLKSISIRLQEKLIEDLKMIAEANGIGYQPLVRTVLTRFVQAEVRKMARDQMEQLIRAQSMSVGETEGGSVPTMDELIRESRVA